MKTTEEEKRLAESRRKARNFLLILIAIGLGLTGVVFLTKHTGGLDAPDWLHNILPLFYTIFYAIIAGLLIFFGIDSFDGYLNHYLKRRDLTNLISVSFVVIFCFLYSALFKQILENVFKK